MQRRKQKEGEEGIAIHHLPQQQQEQQEHSAPNVVQRLRQALAYAFLSINTLLLYSILTFDWLRGYNEKKPQQEGTSSSSSSVSSPRNGVENDSNGVATQQKPTQTRVDWRASWEDAKRMGRRFLALTWSVGEHEPSPSRASYDRSIWLSLRTRPLQASASDEAGARNLVPKGKERLSKHDSGAWPVEWNIESDEVLKLVEIDGLGTIGRFLVIGACLVPVLPELIVATGFFWSIYLLGIAYAFNAQRRSDSFFILWLLGFLHLPFVWVLWFPLVMLGFFSIVVVQSFRSRASMAKDIGRVIGLLFAKGAPNDASSAMNH
jgi:hypothetical protein